jgi:hypothetical protein
MVSCLEQSKFNLRHRRIRSFYKNLLRKRDYFGIPEHGFPRLHTNSLYKHLTLLQSLSLHIVLDVRLPNLPDKKPMLRLQRNGSLGFIQIGLSLSAWILH